MRRVEVGGRSALIPVRWRSCHGIAAAAWASTECRFSRADPRPGRGAIGGVSNMNAGRRRRRLADAGVRPARLPGQPLRGEPAEDRDLHRRHHRPDQPRLPRHRGRLLHDPPHLREAMFDLTQKEQIPVSQISQLTSTDLANGALQSGGYTALIDPDATISATTPVGPAGTPAQAVQAFVNAGGTLLGTGNGGTASAIPPATAVATFAPAGDCGGPAGFGNCYGYEVNANTSLPGRPAVIDQPFGAGHAIMLGFDPWYRAWTTEEERLVLNGLLYPAGTVIPAGQSASEAGRVTAHSRAAARPVPAAGLPAVASRPVNPSGGASQPPPDRDRPRLGGLPRPR